MDGGHTARQHVRSAIVKFLNIDTSAMVMPTNAAILIAGPFPVNHASQSALRGWRISSGALETFYLYYSAMQARYQP